MISYAISFVGKGRSARDFWAHQGGVISGFTMAMQFLHSTIFLVGSGRPECGRLWAKAPVK